MRLLTILVFAAFLAACGGNETQPQQQTQAPTSGHPQYSDTYLENKKRKEQAEKPNITVRIQGLQGGAIAKLIGSFEGQNYLADSAMIDPNGQMVFKKGEAYFPGLLYLLLPGDQNIQMLVDLDQTFTMSTTLNNLVGDMKVDGSLDNQLLYESLKFDDQQRLKIQTAATTLVRFKPGTPEYKQGRDEQDKLAEERRMYLDKMFKENPTSIFTSFKRAGQNPDLRDCYKPDGTMDTLRYTYFYRNRFWDGMDFNDERLLYTPVVSKMLERYITELTPQHPDSIVKYSIKLVDWVVDKPEFFKYFANWIVLKYDPKESTLMDPQAVFVNMIERYFTYDKAVWSDSAEVFGLQQRAYEMTSSLMGKKAANVQVPGLDGKVHALYDMKSPYIVVYMWNPDCEHCAEQTPKLAQMYQQIKAQGVDVYGIAVNAEDAKVREAVKKYNMPWLNVFDPTNKSIYPKFYVDNTPEVYVLNPDRTIIAKNLHVDQIMTMVERDKASKK
jgi:peroxiredoxin